LNVISKKIIKTMLEKKVDGRKFNGGNKGCGRKSKSDERQLVEPLEHEDEALAILFKKSIRR
jgi:hypothetical protein